jgi:hypothetical protein
MADELYKGLYKYRLGKKYDLAKHANDGKLNEGRDYSTDLFFKSVSTHIQRNQTMFDVIVFIQDLFVTMVKAVAGLKIYKSFATPKDYYRTK